MPMPICTARCPLPGREVCHCACSCPIERRVPRDQHDLLPRACSSQATESSALVTSYSTSCSISVFRPLPAGRARGETRGLVLIAAYARDVGPGRTAEKDGSIRMTASFRCPSYSLSCTLRERLRPRTDRATRSALITISRVHFSYTRVSATDSSASRSARLGCHGPVRMGRMGQADARNRPPDRRADRRPPTPARLAAYRGAARRAPAHVERGRRLPPICRGRR